MTSIIFQRTVRGQRNDLTNKYTEKLESLEESLKLLQKRTRILFITTLGILETQRLKCIRTGQHEHGFRICCLIHEGDVANSGKTKFLEVRKYGLGWTLLYERLQNAFVHCEAPETSEAELRHDGSDTIPV